MEQSREAAKYPMWDYLSQFGSNLTQQTNYPVNDVVNFMQNWVYIPPVIKNLVKKPPVVK